MIIASRSIVFGLLFLLATYYSVSAKSIRNVEMMKQSADDADEDGNSPLAECEGECDTDNDCESGLVCFHRDIGTTAVPGCLGNADEVGKGSENFCIKPLLMHVNSAVAAKSKQSADDANEDDDSPLAECEGECDTDDDCESGLVCFQRDKGTTTVPGCLGNADSIGEGSENFCIKPQTHGTIVDEEDFYEPLLPLLVD